MYFGCIAALFLALNIQSGEIAVRSGETIAFVGDSITQFGNRPDGFIHLVMDGLKCNGINAKAIPAGVSGHKSSDIVKRINGILRKNPDWMVLQCGTNDVGHGVRGVKLEDYEKNMSTIFKAAQAAGVRVMLVTPSRLSEDPDHANNIKLEKYCEFLRRQAREHKFLLADWNLMELQAIRKRSGIRGFKVTVDNLHLNGYGNRFLAETILAAFGMDEEKTILLRKKWDEIPSMVPIFNATHNPNYKISIKDYEILYALAEKENISVDAWVKKQIADRIAAEKAGRR